MLASAKNPGTAMLAVPFSLAKAQPPVPEGSTLLNRIRDERGTCRSSQSAAPARNDVTHGDSVGAVHVSPLSISLDTEHPVGRMLPVVAELAPDKAALELTRTTDAGDVGIDPTTATIHAEIKTCPVKHWRRDRHGVRTASEVGRGRKRGGGKQRRCCKKNSFHVFPQTEVAALETKSNGGRSSEACSEVCYFCNGNEAVLNSTCAKARRLPPTDIGPDKLPAGSREFHSQCSKRLPSPACRRRARARPRRAC